VAKLIQKILNRQKPKPDENQPTMSATQSKPQSNPDLPAIKNPLGLVFGAAQSVGRQREHNEDALFALGTYLLYEDNRNLFGFFVVADGMGGHADGELASGLAVKVIAERVVGKALHLFITNQEKLATDSLKVVLEEGFQEANYAVKKQVPGGGTTLTALLIYQDQLVLAHVGDSRVYHIDPEGTTHVLTRDHSFVNQLVELGHLTPDEASVHPQRNILSMAVGQWEPLFPDLVVRSLPDQGHLLLCSDGLWGVVPEKKIAQSINLSEDPEEACHKLIDLANQAGGPDNITAILIRLPDKRTHG
jgi:PPM family protein phosphatase